ncbi:MAG: response regulator transcription factor [Lachnospiraceae bacterium]
MEDDTAINHGIEITLGSEEYEYRKFFSLGEVDNIKQADLVILDINLPDGNGFEFLKQLRQTSNVPVLVLTANDTEIDEVTGLTLGADDYVTKPFSLMALRLRVNNLLSRTVTGQEENTQNIYEKNGLFFDFGNLLFKKNDIEIELSKTEIRLLKYFTENEGITLSREKLIDYVWQNQQFVDENALSVGVKRLRDKIENSGEKLIHTVYGIGYVFKWEK